MCERERACARVRERQRASERKREIEIERARERDRAAMDEAERVEILWWRVLVSAPRRALRGGISKVNFEQNLSTFGNTCPQNGSKNEPGAPRTSLGYPHIGPFVGRANTAHARQSRPDPGLGFQVKVLNVFAGVPCWLASGPGGDARAGAGWRSLVALPFARTCSCALAPRPLLFPCKISEIRLLVNGTYPPVMSTWDLSPDPPHAPVKGGWLLPREMRQKLGTLVTP